MMRRPRKRGDERELLSSEQFLAKAQRFRERAAGVRYALDSHRVDPRERAEMERTLRNLETAATELERMAKGRG
ncbi:MAG: hypothetical protein HYR63_30215 [Proteobacteria bacterium]|nr:hypothetical protein [Pseudomonadota bacterium]MBI3498054.1 hypothetical protein [Pseudomonadota bacterium]